MAGVDDFIKQNAKWLLILVFGAGTIYAQFVAYNNAIKVLDERLDKKIKKQNEIIERLSELERCEHK